MPYLCSRCDRRFDKPLERCPHDGRRVVRDLSEQTVGGRYRLKNLVGIGGMGSSVWSAWQSSTQRQVAVKLLPATSDSAAERFTRGARLASNLSHPNITVVHDYGRTVIGDLYLVMELMEGMNLFRASRKERFQLPRVVHMMDLVLRALGHAHRRSVVHRDIKLSNIFWSPTEDDPEFVKVLDFGIARQFHAAPVVEADGDEVEVTAANQLCGTPQYMAPEQIGFDNIDGRADLYAVGIATYHLLTGEFPFNGTAHELFRHHLQTPPPDLVERSDLDIPSGLARWVAKALEKSVDRRFSSAEEMRDSLQRIDLQPTAPLPTLTPAMLAQMELDEASSGVGTPFPTGTAGEVGDPVDEPEQPRRRRLLVASCIAVLGTALIVNWPSDRPDSGPVVKTAGTKDNSPKPEQVEETPVALPESPSAEAPAEKPTEAPSTRKRIRIVTSPADVIVYQGEERLGVTPMTVSLFPGTHAVRLERKGFVTVTKRVVIDTDSKEGQTHRFELKEQLRPKRVRKRKRSNRKRRAVRSPIKNISPSPNSSSERPVFGDSKEISTDQSKRVKVAPLDEQPHRRPKIEVLE